jgi:hypothetical protein
MSTKLIMDFLLLRQIQLITPFSILGAFFVRIGNLPKMKNISAKNYQQKKNQTMASGPINCFHHFVCLAQKPVDETNLFS